MFLTVAKTSSGDLLDISEFNGSESLYCPFCGEDVITKKGRVRQHHFAHKNETCLQSKSASESLFIPMVDALGFLEGNLKRYIMRRYRYEHSKIFGGYQFTEAIETLEAMGVLKINRQISTPLLQVMDELKLVDESLVNDQMLSSKMRAILSALSPLVKIDIDETPRIETVFSTKFSQIISRGSLLNEYMASKGKKIGNIRLSRRIAEQQEFCIEAAYKRMLHESPECKAMFDVKLNAIRSQSLYVMSFHADIDGMPERFIKVGRTSREPLKRLEEVRRELLVNGGSIYSASVLSNMDGLGRMEKIVHWSLKSHALDRNEYFDLTSEELCDFLYLIEGLSAQEM